MTTLQEARKKIQHNLKGVRDNEIRKKVTLLISVLEAPNISEGCRKSGLVRDTFYEWIKKLKANEFDLTALKNKSRKPFHSPKRTSLNWSSWFWI